MYANKKFSYRKLIARQHSVTKGFGQTWGIVKLTCLGIMPLSYRFSEKLISLEKGNFILLFVYLAPPLRGFHLEFCNCGWTEKLE